MPSRTESRPDPVPTRRDECALARLERIRAGARLVASGRLSPLQIRRTACEIERLAEGLALQQIPPPRRVSGSASDRLARLSARERQVLVGLAGGETVQEVAHRLQRSPKTINNQRTSLLRKLELRNAAELTRFAISEGIISL
jgi:DNA-binding NarL/FixJ family response regulator